MSNKRARSRKNASPPEPSPDSLAGLLALPTFTIKKPSPNGEPTTEIATCTYYDSSIIQPKCAYRNFLFNNPDGENVWPDTKPPSFWVLPLNWPADVFRALIYAEADQYKFGRKTIYLKKHFKCFGQDCPKPEAERERDRCDCTVPAWQYLNNDDWVENNIELVWKGGVLGTAVFLKADFAKGDTIGEFFGELRPPGDEQDGSYSFRIKWETCDKKGRNTEEIEIANLDSIRVGNWTRFMGHSCWPSCSVQFRRVGAQFHIVVVANWNLKAGEEVTINYGDTFWRRKWDQDIFCECGEEMCVFGDPNKEATEGDGESKAVP